jgi:hypothetical protein
MLKVVEAPEMGSRLVSVKTSGRQSDAPIYCLTRLVAFFGIYSLNHSFNQATIHTNSLKLFTLSKHISSTLKAPYSENSHKKSVNN